jgi:hypothetical protein
MIRGEVKASAEVATGMHSQAALQLVLSHTNSQFKDFFSLVSKYEGGHTAPEIQPNQANCYFARINGALGMRSVL